MNKLGKSSLFKASLLAALLTTALGTQAAGLGKLTVYSAIGQPLNAEVAVTATPEELTALSAKLASPDDFKKAGVEFMSALAGLRFVVAKQPDGQPVLRLSTDRPLNEPFLHFLVELNWTAGRLVREYTFLLDPPEMLQAARPASVVTPVVPTAQPTTIAPVLPMAPAAMPVEPTKTDSRPAQVPLASAAGKQRPAPAPAIDTASTGEYRVKPGDTLSKVARENKPDSVSLDQMLVSLFNSNREAFESNNMNRLRAGKILRLPEPGEAASVDAGEARKLIVAQTADFNTYRRRLADAVGVAPAVEAAPQQQATGKIKPQVETKAPPVATKDKLEVSRSETAKSVKATGKSSLEEDLVARDNALREASSRIADLEKNLENLKHLVELKSQAGAQVQQQAQAALPKPVEAKKPEVSAATKPSAEPMQPVTPAAPVPPPVAEKPAAPAPTESAPAVAPVAEPAKPAPMPVEQAPKPAVKKPAAPPPPPPEPSFIEENPEIVFGGGAIVALLLGYLGISSWRRKKQAADQATALNEPALSSAAPVSRSAAGERVDSAEVSIQGDFSEGGVLTTTESVDPVAEADVYMAYGRDSQAEEILLEGLKTDPTRTAIHLKLLELYANRKSVPQFETVARDLYELNGGRGPEWEKAVALATALGITGGLFAVSAASAAMPEKAATPQTITAANPESVAEKPMSAEEAGSFDFDLDLGTSSGPSAAEEQPAETPVADPDAGLDFEFDLGTPTLTPPSGGAAAPADGNNIDFSLDSGTLPGGQEKEIAAPQATADSATVDFDLDLGSVSGPTNEDVDQPIVVAADANLSAGLPEMPVTAQPAANHASELDFDFDLELGAESLPKLGNEAAAPVTPDLADISFDLGEAEPQPPLVKNVAPAGAAIPELGLQTADGKPVVPKETAPVESTRETDESEAATKLELAQAYEEMGDREGARELLNEVLNEGDAEQQAVARARLDQLDL